MDAGQRVSEKSNVEGDRINIMLLLLMYSFQGLVYGLALAFSLIFQNRNVSFPDQAEFSLVFYPYCLKVLWAPIVDCVFSKRLGRRKTWITPTQYLMGKLYDMYISFYMIAGGSLTAGITLLIASIYVDDWLGSEDGSTKPEIRVLTVVFFTCSLLSAIQDVALDGWALTMLKKRNTGYAMSCQSIGLAVGQFVGYVGFITLDSKDFCNFFRSVPQNHGFVSLPAFLFSCSMVLTVSTTLIVMFKKDDSLEVINDENCECRLGLKESYTHMWNIVKLRPMTILCLLILTYYVGFGPQHGVAHLKIIDLLGVSKDNFVLLTLPALPVQIMLSIWLRRSLVGSRSAHAFIMHYILLLLAGIFLAIILFLSPLLRDEQNLLPKWYYWILFSSYNARLVIRYLMQLAIGAFFCRISDPRYGGIYLTVLNAILNMAINWPSTLSLWSVDQLTVGTCADTSTTTCLSKFDGFYTETIIFTVLGGLWLCWGRKQLYRLEKLDASEWVLERREAKVIKDGVPPTPVHTNGV